jgi:hypothetical protein
MGAWSHEPFGNDTANDWAYGLDEVSDLSYIEETIDRALEEGEYLDASDGEETLAAIEVLAHLLGKGTQSDSYTQKIALWAKRVGDKPNPALLQKARQALQRVVSEKSELQELWEETEDSEVWLASIQQLSAALGAEHR